MAMAESVAECVGVGCWLVVEAAGWAWADPVFAVRSKTTCLAADDALGLGLELVDRVLAAAGWLHWD